MHRKGKVGPEDGHKHQRDDAQENNEANRYERARCFLVEGPGCPQLGAAPRPLLTLPALTLCTVSPSPVMGVLRTWHHSRHLCMSPAPDC